MRWGIIVFLFMISCGNEGEEKISAANPADSTAKNSKIDGTDTSTSYLANTTNQNAITAPPIKKPSGIYQFSLPYEKNSKVLHTISFRSGTFQLQEILHG